MTDKVQKIREEVERLKGWNNNVRNSTRHMTLQEEDFNRGKHSSYLEILDFIDSLQEEPVSEELEKVAIKYAEKKCYIDNAVYTDNELREAKEKPRFHFYDIAAAFMEGSEWQKQQLMKDAVDSEACYTMGVPSIIISLPDGIKVRDKVKVIIIKED